MATNYHNPASCNKCGQPTNEYIIEFYDEQHNLMEVETKCKKCGFDDHWAYGFFNSSRDMVSNCETYSYDA